VAVAPARAEATRDRVIAAGYPSARIVGRAAAGAPGIVVE